MLPWLEQEAKARQGRRTDLYPDNNSTSVKKLTQVHRAAADAAKVLRTNRQYVSDAKTIKEKAPQLFEAVKRGDRRKILRGGGAFP
jgi:hypothetical protein